VTAQPPGDGADAAPVIEQTPVLDRAGVRVPPRRRRRRSRWRAAFFALAGLVIVGGAGWALLGNQVFVVNSISVTGTHLVTRADVIAAADVPLGTPLLRVDAGAVTRRVESLRQVASVTVTEDWPDQLTITVTERVPVLAVRMAAGGYAQIDHDGVILRTTAKPAGLPQLTTPLTGAALTGAVLRGDPAVEAAADVLAELTPSLRRQVAVVRTTALVTGDGNGPDAQRVTLRLRDGVTVVWGDTGNAAAKNREVAIAVGSHMPGGQLRYVDVTSPGIVVTR
jgi:cell division protein FtsQ